MSFESSLSDNSIAFPDCMGATSLVGDGSCDDRNNNLVCMFAISRIGCYVFIWAPINTDHVHVFNTWYVVTVTQVVALETRH